MEALWYYEDAGRQQGPIGEAALRELIRSGRLAPDARVWRSGMPGWQPWRTLPGLASAPAAAAAPSPAPAPGALTEVELPLLVILSIVTLGVYGLVMFYRTGERYARLAPQRRSNFETLFWIYVACYVLQFTGWLILGRGGVIAWIASFVVGILLLNEVLASRAELLRANRLKLPLMSDTAHRALWIVGALTSWFVVGIALLVVQGFKFFDDHNAIVRALRAGGAQPDAGGPIPVAEPVAPTAPAPPAGPTPLAAAPAGAPAAEPLPAERACIRCGGPLAPADRFCSACGAPAA